MNTALQTNSAFSLEQSAADIFNDCQLGNLRIADPINLTFEDSVESCELSYSVYGDLNNPVIVILGGISANKYVADTHAENSYEKGWWDLLVGHGKAVDLDKFCVVSFDYWAGKTGDGKATGRKHLSAQTNENDSIKISTFDQARILERLLNHLKISKLQCLIGASYGGMVGLAFAQKFPDKLEQLIAIGCTEQSSAKNTALRSLQREILQFAVINNQEKKGLTLARSLAMLGYRGEQELESRFENLICEDQQLARFPINDYLGSQGEKFAEKFSAERFINLSLSVDLHKIDPAKISVKCLCVGIHNDLIAPIEKVKNLTKKIGKNAEFLELKSNFGHDGFLKEFDQLEQILTTRLEH